MCVCMRERERENAPTIRLPYLAGRRMIRDWNNESYRASADAFDLTGTADQNRTQRAYNTA